jgi:plastocyanin
MTMLLPCLDRRPRPAAERRRWLAVPAAALVALVSACAGDGAPTGPDAVNVVAINIVGSNGNSAYTPNPATVSAGASVMLKNYTTETHHIVRDDGSANFGEIAAGSSSARELRTGGGNYHCTIHRTMVGSINGQLPTEPRRCDPDFYDLSHCCDGFYC